MSSAEPGAEPSELERAPIDDSASEGVADRLSKANLSHPGGGRHCPCRLPRSQRPAIHPPRQPYTKDAGRLRCWLVEPGWKEALISP